MATAIPKAYLASSAIRCRDVETGPNLGVLAVFPSTGATCRCPLRLCCNFRAATSGWTTFGKHCTGSPIMPSDNPFKWRQFEPALILQCVRWYLRYALSYRDLEDMMRERGLCVDHTTIYRWVQRYAPEIDKRCRPFLRRTNDSYRIDETYVRVAGAWTYLYRGVDSNGDTLDCLLRATRDRKAAIAFFRKTLGAAHTTPPRVVTVDKNPAYPVAFEAVRHEGLVRPRSNLRQCKYLNNIIEQDHRFIKRRTRPMLGFKRFTTAWRTLRGLEIMHALRKGQARWMAKGDVVGQTQLIHKVRSAVPVAWVVVGQTQLIHFMAIMRVTPPDNGAHGDTLSRRGGQRHPRPAIGLAA